MAKSILAIGAHYDDCVFGIPGVLLAAREQGYRVVVLSIIGDYTNWAPVGQSRQTQMVEGTRAVCAEFGVEIEFLKYRSMGFQLDEESRRAVSEVVLRTRPELGLLLWPHDTHPDHEAASAMSQVAFRYAGTVLNDSTFSPPPRLYYYDNGPRHTRGFEPDTFVDITRHWSQAIGWLGKLMAVAVGQDSPGRFSGALKSKEMLAGYRGRACGVDFAEALRSFVPYPSGLFQD